MIYESTSSPVLQTTQHTIGGSVAAVTNCCANCVKPSRPQQWGPDLTFCGASRPCGPAGWLALLLTKAGYVETNPGPSTSNKRVWICDILYKQIHVRKQISIRCNMIEQSPNQILSSNHPLSNTLSRTKHIHISRTPPTPARTTLIHNTTTALNTISEPRVPPTCLHLPQPHLIHPHNSIAINLPPSHSVFRFYSPLNLLDIGL